MDSLLVPTQPMPSCMGNAVAAQEEEMPEGWESQKTMEIHSQAGHVSVIYTQPWHWFL